MEYVPDKSHTWSEWASSRFTANTVGSLNQFSSGVMIILLLLFLPKVYLKTKKMTDISQTQAGFKAKSRRNPLWIPRLFNAKSRCVCRNRRYFRLSQIPPKGYLKQTECSTFQTHLKYRVNFYPFRIAAKRF